MAYELNAVLRLRDDLSRPLRRATHQVERSRSSMSRLTSETQRTSRAMSGLSRAGGGIGSLVKGALAVGAAYATANVAAKAFSSTIAAAAKSEMATSSMTALFKGNTAAAKEFYDFIQMKGAESVLSDDDFMAASRTFAIMTKDMGELRELVNIGERLAVMDPAQGISGAAVALRELSSGDIVSLAERFEMPKKVLNQIKNLPLKAQLKALDKELSSYGVTQDMIFAQGQTALGLYNKTVDKTRVAFRNMGFGALEELKPLLRDINTWLDKNSESITKFGSKILTDLSGGFRRAGAYILTNYLENDKWLALNFADKIKVVASDISAVFNNWWSGGGKATFESVSTNITGTLLASLENSTGRITEIGIKLGASLMSGIYKAMRDSDSLGWLVKSAEFVGGGKGSGMDKLFNSVGIDVHGSSSKATAATGASSRALASGQLPTTFGPDTAGFFKSLPKKSGGISRVPGTMPAMLHRDEAVLHRGEARQWRNGGASGAPSVTITGNIHIHTEADYQAFVSRLVTDIHRAGEAGA